MATIPIEVILQDAEEPVVPTPEPETDITVPDTGAEFMGSNISFSTSSMIGIIIPTMLLILAITTIFVLLVHKHHKKQNKETNASKKEKLATVTSSTIAVLSATVLISNLIIPTTKAASDNEGLITEDKITIVATRQESSDAIIATAKDTSYATANFDFGYKVTASMAEGLTSANLYLDGDKTSEYYFSPVGDGELVDNTWGYTLEEGGKDYLPIPLVDTPATITKGTDAIEGKTVDIYYNIKADKDMPNGTYTGELEYILTDNNFPSTLTTMQGMTTEICENTFTPGNQVTDPVPTATLEDIRDHKTYTIAKLADGNCWMTQNLDLDIDEKTTYTHADTDLGWSDPAHLDPTAKWKPEEGHSTIRFTGETVSGWVSSNTAPYSADPGYAYYYTSGNDENDKKYESLEACEEEHNDGSCPHYHAGNYYNWSAAVASNDTSGMIEQYGNAPDSICPAGWKLPEGPNVSSVYSNEMVDTIRSYDSILEKSITEGCGGVCSFYKYLSDGFNNIRISPLWLVRAGTLTGSTLGYNGSAGYYWSSTTLAWNSPQVGISAWGIYPASHAAQFFGSKHGGFSVRCLAR